MLLNQYLVPGLLAMGSLSHAKQIPFDHIMWGERNGTDKYIAKRGTTVQPSSSSVTSTPILSAAVTGSSVESGSGIPVSSIPASSAGSPHDPVCTNSPSTRACWLSGFSVAADFDKKWPITGKTVYYNLELVNTTCNLDGHGDRVCLLFNGQYPGPTIRASWGDMISVTVKNSMPNNGSSIHWHGIRQLLTNYQDGVNGITQCALAPGDTQNYLFRATQYGTTWYHSHFSSQYGDGLVGSIVIDGPATANYDIDLGPFPVTDWYYLTAYQVEYIANVSLQVGKPPPPGDNILVNGTNKNANGGGAYNNQTIISGKKYRLRLINMSSDNSIRVSLDSHTFTLITSDLVPIDPVNTSWILLAIGQRYDVIFTANQKPGNYWFRAEVANDCATENNFYGRAVFTYSSVTPGIPTTNGTAPNSVCQPGVALTPFATNVIPNTTFMSQVQDLEVDITREQITTNGQNIAVWAINLTAIDIYWDKPTLAYVFSGNTSYPQTYNLIEIPHEGIWTFWIIQETAGTPAPIPHPMHLHGHDFWVLGQGTGVFDKNSDAAKLNFDNPTRRDVQLLPAGGWIVLAWPTDNPGAWLLHCHISWHISQGLGVQFLESQSTIPVPGPDWNKTCVNWVNYYYDHPVYTQDDSGL